MCALVNLLNQHLLCKWNTAMQKKNFSSETYKSNEPYIIKQAAIKLTSKRISQKWTN